MKIHLSYRNALYHHSEFSFNLRSSEKTNFQLFWIWTINFYVVQTLNFRVIFEKIERFLNLITLRSVKILISIKGVKMTLKINYLLL